MMRRRGRAGATTPRPGRNAPTRGIDTWLVHGAEARDLNAGSVVPPIYQTTTFHYPGQYSEAAPPRGKVHLYTRLENPTTTQVARVVAGLEGAEAARVYASGMGALSAAIFSSLRQGDEVVALDELYGNTLTLLRDDLPRFGVRLHWVPGQDSSRVEEFVTPRTRLVVLESPTNPTLEVHDLRTWAKAAHSVGALFLVDNTFATPVNQTPLSWGADLVMHSATKYLAGHSDVMAGALAGSRPRMEGVRHLSETLGATLDPLGAFLLARGLKTLGLRMRRHNENGRAVAEDLEDHPKVLRVHYPGSRSATQEAICRRQMKGRGGMVSVVVRGGLNGAHRFMRGLGLVHRASSLGGVESLASLPVETSHRQLSPEDRRARGIDDGMVRISLGIEDPADLIADLRHALGSV